MKFKNIYLLFISIVMVFVYFFMPGENVVEETYSEESLVYTVFDLEIEEYIIGVVAAEMPASFDMEALKAQAIASRSYAVYKLSTGGELTTDVTTQAFITEEEMISKWGDDYSFYYEKIKEAVYDTAGLVLKSDGSVIEAFYFAISNGYTEDSVSVFGESLDYISSVESSWDLYVNNYEVTTSFSEDEIISALSLGCSEVVIDDVSYTDANYVSEISVCGEIFSGTEFRSLLGLRSSDFSITFTSDEVLITTKGYGHGVGMSQYGANEMAKEGYMYDEILEYYYKDVEILNM